MNNLLRIYLFSPLVLSAAELNLINDLPIGLNIIVQRLALCEPPGDAESFYRKPLSLYHIGSGRAERYDNVDAILFNLKYWDPSGYDNEKYSLLFRIVNPTEIILNPLGKETYILTSEKLKKEVSFPPSLKFINLQPLVYFYNSSSLPVQILYRIRRKSGIKVINQQVMPESALSIDIDDSNNLEGFAVFTQDGKTIVYHNIPLSGKTYKIQLGDNYSYEPTEIARSYYEN